MRFHRLHHGWRSDTRYDRLTGRHSGKVRRRHHRAWHSLFRSPRRWVHNPSGLESRHQCRRQRRGVLDAVRKIRTTSEIPIVLFTYLNPVYIYGFDKFHADASAAGADGVLILDLPPDEAARNAELMKSHSLLAIRLIAPTTPPERMELIAKSAEGFIYYVSREGVTGEQTSLSASIGSQVREIKSHTPLPIAVGFGISTPEQAAEVAKESDAVVVGSAIVRRIGEFGTHPNLNAEITAFVAPIAQAIKHG